MLEVLVSSGSELMQPVEAGKPIGNGLAANVHFNGKVLYQSKLVCQQHVHMGRPFPLVPT